MKTKVFVSLLVALSVVAFFSCKKDAGQSSVQIRLTDAPGDWDEVNIDLKEVHIKLDNDSVEWKTLEAKPGIYNLLGLQNGVDSLIGKGNFQEGQVIKEIRLVVGDSNTIKVKGETYPLTIPSGAESGLKIKISKKLQATLETLVIDFDAALSIKEEPNGYKLKPVIRLK
jgi:hypothetical protein